MIWKTYNSNILTEGSCRSFDFYPKILLEIQYIFGFCWFLKLDLK